MRSLVRTARRFHNKQIIQRRSLANFAELYRKSIDSAPLQPGDSLQGHVVGRQRPRSSSSRFYIVDFGLKSEAPFTAKEIPGASNIGDKVTLPLLALEDDFNEPVLDYDRKAQMPAITAERYALLTRTARTGARFVHGRFASFKRGGASVKVLGNDAFIPRHHVVALDRPVLGSFAPFYVISVSADKRSTGGTPGLDVNTVVSSYGGFLFCLANLVGIDEVWKKSGGGSNKERLAYLQLLTRLLAQKNTAVRRILPKNSDTARRRSYRRAEHSRGQGGSKNDSAWLHDLPQGDWVSSGQTDNAKIWDRLRRPVALRPRQKAEINSAERESSGQSRPSRPRNTKDQTEKPTEDF